MLDRMINAKPLSASTDAKGNLGLSYTGIYNKITALLKLKYPVTVTHIKAAKLLYVSRGILVKDNSFGNSVIGNMDILTVYDELPPDPNIAGMPYDIASIDGKPILFIFYEALFGDNLTLDEKFSNIYLLYTILVSMSLETGMAYLYSSIYSLIARSAPLVFTIKTFLQLGLNVNAVDINLQYIPEDDAFMFREEVFDAIKDIDIEEIMSYGALCELIRQ